MRHLGRTACPPLKYLVSGRAPRWTYLRSSESGMPRFTVGSMNPRTCDSWKTFRAKMVRPQRALIITPCGDRRVDSTQHRLRTPQRQVRAMVVVVVPTW
jgi:hypothetical protein